MTVTISPVNMEDRQKIGVRAGDTVRVWQKIQEKGKTRLQAFEGLVLAHKHGNEAGATFTVRKVSNGVGVEKIFPLYSPMIDKIEVLRRSKVRRAKLYFIRDKVAREIRKQMRNMRMMDISTVSDIEEKDRVEKEAVATAEAEAEEKAEKPEEEKPARSEDHSGGPARSEDHSGGPARSEDHSGGPARSEDHSSGEETHEAPAKESEKETPEEPKEEIPAEEEKKEETK